MRNLKRALSLTLASVMLLGMMVVGSSAAGYPDVDSNDNAEAIEVLQAVKVMVGDDNGNFNPDDQVNRAQMAVVMALLLDLNYNYYQGADPGFWDVPSWAAPYVAACYANGIVSGYGNGQYGSADPVTAVQAASMMMRALGYFKYQSDYQGNFELATVSQASKIRLFDNIDAKSKDALTRSEVAQLALNTLQTPIVEPSDKTINVIDGNGNVIATGGQVDYVVVASNQSYAQAIDHVERSGDGLNQVNGYTVELGEQLYNGKLELRDDNRDDFGRPARTWVYNGSEIGSYAKKELLREDYIEAVKGKTIYELVGQAPIRDYTLLAYLDGAVNTGIDAEKDLTRNNNADLYGTGRGVLTEVYLDNEKDQLYIVSINTWLARASADYNSNSESITLTVYNGLDKSIVKRVELEDAPYIANMKKDDWCLVQWYGDVMEDAKDTTGFNDKTVAEVFDVEIREDQKVTGFKRDKVENAGNINDKNGDSRVTEITTGGETYKNNAKAWYKYKTLTDLNNNELVGKTYTMFMDQYGNFIGAELYSGKDQYVFITGYDRNGSNISVNTAKAAAIFTDGTMQAIDVNTKDTDKNIETYNKNKEREEQDYVEWRKSDGENGQSEENMWYKYTVYNGVYTLTPVDNYTKEVNNTTTDRVIDSSKVYLRPTDYDDTPGAGLHKGVRSYGEDASIYITVSADTVDLTTHRGITEVTGTYTGAQDVNLVVEGITYDKEDAEHKYPITKWIHAVCDNNDNYIIAAIVWGEAEGAVENYAYICDGVNKEWKEEDNSGSVTHFWEFDTVLNGEKVTKTIKSKYSNTVDELDPGHVQQLILDTDGYVTKIKDVERLYDNAEFNKPNDKLEKFDAYHIATTGGDVVTNNWIADWDQTPGINAAKYVTNNSSRFATNLYLQGNTIHYDTGDEDIGLFVKNNAKAVVYQRVNGSNTWENYDSVRSAYSVLNDADEVKSGKQFDGQVIAALDSNGVAAWVLFIDSTETKNNNNNNNTNSGNDSYTDGRITITVDRNDMKIEARDVRVEFVGRDLSISIPKDYARSYDDNGLCVEVLVNGYKVDQAKYIRDNANGTRYMYETDGLNIRSTDRVEVKITAGDKGGDETTYDVAVKVGEGGTAKADVEKAAKGSTVTVTAVPAGGYKVETMTTNVTGTNVTVNGNVGTFTMPASAVTVTVTFVKDQSGETEDVKLTEGSTGVKSVTAKDKVMSIVPEVDDESKLRDNRWYQVTINGTEYMGKVKNGVLVTTDVRTGDEAVEIKVKYRHSILNYELNGIVYTPGEGEEFDEYPVLPAPAAKLARAARDEGAATAGMGLCIKLPDGTKIKLAFNERGKLTITKSQINKLDKAMEENPEWEDRDDLEMQPLPQPESNLKATVEEKNGEKVVTGVKATVDMPAVKYQKLPSTRISDEGVEVEIEWFYRDEDGEHPVEGEYATQDPEEVDYFFKVKARPAADKPFDTEADVTITVEQIFESGSQTSTGTVDMSDPANPSIEVTVPVEGEGGEDVLEPEPIPTPPTMYTITVDAGENGSAEADMDEAEAGDTVTVTAVPEAGFVVDTMETDVEGTEVTINGNVGTFTMPAGDVTVTVTFKGEEASAGKVFMTINAPDGYTVKFDDGAGVSGTYKGEKVEVGETAKVTLTVTTRIRGEKITVEGATLVKGETNKYEVTANKEALEITITSEKVDSFKLTLDAIAKAIKNINTKDSLGNSKVFYDTTTSDTIKDATLTVTNKTATEATYETEDVYAGETVSISATGRNESGSGSSSASYVVGITDGTYVIEGVAVSVANQVISFVMPEDNFGLGITADGLVDLGGTAVDEVVKVTLHDGVEAKWTKDTESGNISGTEAVTVPKGATLTITNTGTGKYVLNNSKWSPDTKLDVNAKIDAVNSDITLYSARKVTLDENANEVIGKIGTTEVVKLEAGEVDTPVTLSNSAYVSVSEAVVFSGGAFTAFATAGIADAALANKTLAAGAEDVTVYGAYKVVVGENLDITYGNEAVSGTKYIAPKADTGLKGGVVNGKATNVVSTITNKTYTTNNATEDEALKSTAGVTVDKDITLTAVTKMTLTNVNAWSGTSEETKILSTTGSGSIIYVKPGVELVLVSGDNSSAIEVTVGTAAPTTVANKGTIKVGGEAIVAKGGASTANIQITNIVFVQDEESWMKLPESFRKVCSGGEGTWAEVNKADTTDYMPWLAFEVTRGAGMVNETLSLTADVRTPDGVKSVIMGSTRPNGSWKLAAGEGNSAWYAFELKGKADERTNVDHIDTNGKAAPAGEYTLSVNWKATASAGTAQITGSYKQSNAAKNLAGLDISKISAPVNSTETTKENDTVLPGNQKFTATQTDTGFALTVTKSACSGDKTSIDEEVYQGTKFSAMYQENSNIRGAIYVDVCAPAGAASYKQSFDKTNWSNAGHIDGTEESVNPIHILLPLPNRSAGQTAKATWYFQFLDSQNNVIGMYGVTVDWSGMPGYESAPVESNA